MRDNLTSRVNEKKIVKDTVKVPKLSQNWTFDLHENLRDFDLLHRFWLTLGFSRDKPKLSQDLSYSRDFSRKSGKK